MKKLVCILLTLVMVMSLSITAFAVDDYKDVESLTENNTQDITITNTINQGEGSATTAPKYYVGIRWTVSAGVITVDRTDAYYEWNTTDLKYVLSGEPSNYVLSSDSITNTNVDIEVTNYSNADIGYEITWTTEPWTDQYFGVQESNADPDGVCRANTRIWRADTEYMNLSAVDEDYKINPDAEGFGDCVGGARVGTYTGILTFNPQTYLDQLYNLSSITLGKYTVTIGNPPSLS